MNINISRIHYPVTTLGPGRRIGIWFQGCSLKCEGCISVDTWPHGLGATTVETVMSSIDVFLPTADGITISGGEPFEQFDALKLMLERIRKVFSGDILVYSGFEFEKLSKMLEEVEGNLDALISEPFLVDAPQTLPWRGSDNQNLHKLTHLGRERFRDSDQPVEVSSKTLDIVLDDDSTLWMAGIPKRGDMKALLKILAQNGLHGTSTEYRGAEL